MKIFISHSSKNSNYGNALVDLLIGVGVKSDQIIFTSNDAYGIPIGQNIFTWLKNKINEKPYVIYLLSSDYYDSVACLNEMGAAWVVENEHTMIFTPDFELDSYEFRNGAIDPREIGFRINNHNKLVEFIESFKREFDISKKAVLINQKILEFLKRIEEYSSKKKVHSKVEIKATQSEEKIKEQKIIKNKEIIPTEKTSSRLLTDLRNDKLKDEEIILIHYILDTSRYQLGTGWQENNEIENIKAWEDINEINSTLSSNYDRALRRFKMRGLTNVSDHTSHGNPKEVSITQKVQLELLDIPDDLLEKISNVINNNKCLW